MAKQPIETLNTEQQTTFRNEIGALKNDSESVLALLADADLEVASIGLTDSTGTALDAGRIALNANNDPVVHDNESNAEDLPHLVNSREATAFAKRVAFTSGATQTHLVTRLPMTAAQVANNTLVHFVGQVRSAWGEGILPTTPVVNLVICREGQNPATEGIRLTIAAPSYSEVISFHLPMKFVVSAGSWNLSDLSSIPTAIAQKNTAGTITHVSAWEFGSDYDTVSAVSGTDGEPAVLEIYLRTTNASATGSEFLYVSGNLAAISQ